MYASEWQDLRASDAEREQAAGRLRAAATQGRLSADKLYERLGVVYSARTSVSALETALSVALEHDLDANTDLSAAQRSTLLSQGHGWIATFVNSSCGGTRAQGGWWG